MLLGSRFSELWHHAFRMKKRQKMQNAKYYPRLEWRVRLVQSAILYTVYVSTRRTPLKERARTKPREALWEFSGLSSPLKNRDQRTRRMTEREGRNSCRNTEAENERGSHKDSIKPCAIVELRNAATLHTVLYCSCTASYCRSAAVLQRAALLKMKKL